MLWRHERARGKFLSTHPSDVVGLRIPRSENQTPKGLGRHRCLRPCSLTQREHVCHAERRNKIDTFSFFFLPSCFERLVAVTSPCDLLISFHTSCTFKWVSRKYVAYLSFF